MPGVHESLKPTESSLCLKFKALWLGGLFPALNGEIIMKLKLRLVLSFLVVAILIAQYGCTFKSLQMTKEEIQQPKDSEGIIFGSILVEAKEPENDSIK